jgi:hypothetical protein
MSFWLSAPSSLGATEKKTQVGRHLTISAISILAKMRFGSVTVKLKSDQCELEEVLVKGKNFVVAKPGKEYTIHVTFHREGDGFFSLFKNTGLVRVGVYVDGVDAGYWKRLDLNAQNTNSSASVTFYGFKMNTSDIRAFTFADVHAVSDMNLNRSKINNASLGKIRVVIYESIPIEGVFDNRSGSQALLLTNTIDSERKFWEQASVSTSAGRSMHGVETFQAVKRWKSAQTSPDLDITLLYHTRKLLSILETTEEKPRLKRQAEDTLSSSASKQKKSEPIDLAVDANLNEGEGADSENSGKDSDPKEIKNDVIDDEIEIIPVIKEIPMLDVETNTWSSVTQTK